MRLKILCTGSKFRFEIRSGSGVIKHFPAGGSPSFYEGLMNLRTTQYISFLSKLVHDSMFFSQFFFFTRRAWLNVFFSFLSKLVHDSIFFNIGPQMFYQILQQHALVNDFQFLQQVGALLNVFFSFSNRLGAQFNYFQIFQQIGAPKCFIRVFVKNSACSA